MLEKVLSTTEAMEVEKLQQRLSSEQSREVSFDEALTDWLQNHAVRWRERRQAEMLARQREEIQRHKWIESEKAHRDLGSEAALDWIRRYAAQWRKWYEDEYTRTGT